LKPWYKVVTPREDLRESKPLDASEFAVHLDQVRDGRAPTVYRNADEFLDHCCPKQDQIVAGCAESKDQRSVETGFQKEVSEFQGTGACPNHMSPRASC
jgi:hypothetical protein